MHILTLHLRDNVTTFIAFNALLQAFHPILSCLRSHVSNFMLSAILSDLSYRAGRSLACYCPIVLPETKACR